MNLFNGFAGASFGGEIPKALLGKAESQVMSEYEMRLARAIIRF